MANTYAEGMQILEELRDKIGDGIIKVDGACYTLATRDLKMLCQYMYLLGVARAGIPATEQTDGIKFDGAMKEMFDIL